ncbi:MAG: polysaccharide deacetylase family protein [Armatimonadota bacterium]
MPFAILAAMLCLTSCQHQPEGITPFPKRHADKLTKEKFWQGAIEKSYRSPEELNAQQLNEQRHGLNLAILARGNPKDMAVALTFDDGPHPAVTPKLLAILKQNHIKATFFVVGFMAEKHPELIKQILAGGHVVANHTYHHVNLTKLPEDYVPYEWSMCNDVLWKITQRPVRFCRPPGGDYDPDVVKAAHQNGLTTVLWTDDPGDYASPGDLTILRRTLHSLRPGGIILLHDGIQQTLDVLPTIIETAKYNGLRFITVEQMAAEVHLTPVSGTRPKPSVKP